MADISYQEIQNNLKQRKFSPIYFLHGEEPYFIDCISDYIEKNVLTEAERGFNQVVLYGKDVDVVTVLSNAKRYPMMSEKQVVIVKEAQEIKDINKESGQDSLVHYINNPLNSTILVFCHKKKLDNRKKMAKELKDKALIFESKKLYDNQIPQFISRMADEQGYKINSRASYIFSEFVGNNLSRINKEFEKLTITAEKGKEIDEVDVQRNIGISKEYNIFELQSALVRRDTEKAFRIANYFAENPKNNPLIVNISVLFSFFTRVLLAHLHLQKNDRDLAAAIGLGNGVYFINEYRTACKTFSRAKTIEAIQNIHIADLQSKSIGYSNLNEEMILKELIYKLLN